MAEKISRQTKKLSRQTIQAMLEMKSLLRRYGITVSLAAPDAYEQLIRSSENLDDEAIQLLHKQLVETKIPGGRHMAPKHIREDAPSTRAEDNQVAPIRKAVYPCAPHEGRFTCDQCHKIIMVTMEHVNASQPLYMQCSCGMQYQVLMESRKYSRVSTHLPGLYIDLTDPSRTGTIVVENVSFGGVRFHVTSPHALTHDDCLYVQFILNDEHETLIWEQVRIHYIDGNSIGAEFVDEESPERALDLFLKLSNTDHYASLYGNAGRLVERQPMLGLNRIEQ